MKSTVSRLWPAVTLTIAIGVVAFVLSFAALADLARDSGIPVGLAWLWPLAVDGAIVLGTALVVTVPGSRYGWVMLTAAVAVSVAGNAAHAAGFGVVGVLVAAVPPVALVAATHALVVLGRAHDTGTPGAHPLRTETVAESAPGMPTGASAEAHPGTDADAHKVPTDQAASAPTTEQDVHTKPNPSSTPKRLVTRPAAQGNRRTRDQYLAAARAALETAHDAGERVEVSPKWVVEVTGASRNTASKIAAELRMPVAVAVAR